jgi:hypothetical protein
MSIVHFSNGTTPPPPEPSIFDDPSLDPEIRLKHVLEAQRRAFDEWDEACRVADDIDPMEQPDELENARRAVRNAYRRWSEIADQSQMLSEGLRRHKLEVPDTEEFQAVYQRTLDGLQAQFDGGPHYRLLCERVAGLHVRLKQMETSGRQYAPAEHSALNSQLLSYVNQLQKYTESMKSENITKESQAVAEAILAMVEKHLSASQPDLWNAIMKDVRGALEGARQAA